MPSDLAWIVRQTAIGLVQEYMAQPYLARSEHGLHVLYFDKLWDALPPNRRYVTVGQHRLCAIQKEYPTDGALGKPKRQNWDIALLKEPMDGICSDRCPLESLPLAAVIEFGLNEASDLLCDDLCRLSRATQVDYGLIVHLYRLTASKQQLSGKDWSTNSKRILNRCQAEMLYQGFSYTLLRGFLQTYR